MKGLPEENCPSRGEAHSSRSLLFSFRPSLQACLWRLLRRVNSGVCLPVCLPCVVRQPRDTCTSGDATSADGHNLLSQSLLRLFASSWTKTGIQESVAQPPIAKPHAGIITTLQAAKQHMTTLRCRRRNYIALFAISREAPISYLSHTRQIVGVGSTRQSSK